MPSNTSGGRNDNMLTPKYLFEQLNNIFKFDVDAACIKANSLCDEGFYFDLGFDGLTQVWGNRAIFCNPPFSQKAKWMEKAHWEVTEGNCPVCVMLLPTNSMDASCWHDWVYSKCHRYDILNRRVAFIDPATGKPKKGNDSGLTIVYFLRKIVVPKGG